MNGEYIKAMDFDKFYEEDAHDSHIDTLLKQAFKGANISSCLTVKAAISFLF